MSVKYYQKLFKEYALADLSRYQENKIGLRWRTEKEVVVGKGQFICGNKACQVTRDLHSYEVFFSYKEQGEKKQCLVKVRVCVDCAIQLFYQKVKKLKKKWKTLSNNEIHKKIAHMQKAQQTAKSDTESIPDELQELLP